MFTKILSTYVKKFIEALLILLYHHNSTGLRFRRSPAGTPADAPQPNNIAVLAQGREMRRSGLQTADENDLIARAALGDREAFGALYERYVFRVFRHVYHLADCDPHTAEDITAQTFLKALEAIHRYERRGVPFLAWLLRISYNLTMNHKKSRATATTLLPDTFDIEGDAPSPEQSCEARIDDQGVWEGVRNLRGDQRHVIVMHFLDDLSYSDIASVLGKSIGAVRVIQHRALSALRHWMEREMAGRPHHRLPGERRPQARLGRRSSIVRRRKSRLGQPLI